MQKSPEYETGEIEQNQCIRVNRGVPESEGSHISKSERDRERMRERKHKIQGIVLTCIGLEGCALWLEWK